MNINKDINEKEIDKKHYWFWAIFTIFALFMLEILGIIIVTTGYYLWSRHAH